MTCFKKIYLTTILLLVVSVGYAYDNYSDAPSYGDGANCSPCQPACCGKGFLSADLLYWRAFEDGLDTCVPTSSSDSIGADGTVTSRFRAKGRDPHFEWNPGFRIRAGFEPACYDWDIGASWTHFHSKAHDSRSYRNKFRWNIDLDVIDVVAGYDFDSYSCFAWRPFIGIRGARIDQHFRTRELFDGFGAQRHNKEDFYGAGPLFGLEADWTVWCNFKVYANASVSWLYGNFDIKLIEKGRTVNSRSFCHVKKHLNAILTSADAGLGIRWETCICEKQVFLQLGLEHHRYFDYNRIGDCCGDLSFDGVNLGIGLEF